MILFLVKTNVEKLLNGRMNIAERRYLKEKQGKILTRFF